MIVYILNFNSVCRPTLDAVAAPSCTNDLQTGQQGRLWQSTLANRAVAHYRAGQPSQALRMMRCAMLADTACVSVAYNFCVLLCRGESLPFLSSTCPHRTCIQHVHPAPQC